jgi:hypothetical protein
MKNLLYETVYTGILALFPQGKKGSRYLRKCDNLNFKEKKSPISSDNREKS